MRWTTYNADTDSDLKSWIELNIPSEVSVNDGVAWISVRSPSNDQDGARDDQTIGDILHLKQLWESLKSSAEPITVHSISEIAKETNILTGKWMCFPRTGNEVNSLWKKIATAVATGSLPPSHSAKVSPTEPGKSAHVICVYNNDFTNVEEVYELEKALRKLDIKCKLLYKPDVYTHIGIYANNKWGLSAAPYQSLYNFITKESKIIKKY